MATETDFKTSPEAVAANNPKVNLKLVEEAKGFIAERRAKGRPRRGYNLASRSRHVVTK